MDKKGMGYLKQDKETKKILILSLGTGSILGKDVDVSKMTLEEKKEKLARREYSYRSAIYYFDDKKNTFNTEFVAEPLMKRFCPDEVFIIGTSKSSWTGFYGKFGDENDQKDEAVLRLFGLEENGGKDLDSSELRKYTQTIEWYFNKGMQKGIFAGVKVHVIVMHYGINSEELLENYCLIRDAIGGVLSAEKDKYQYEIAFDITHSFRSMPIYNLVVINYLQNVSQIDLEITHIPESVKLSQKVMGIGISL
ncbi:MAG: CRISPR-associated DxTHG motif protein [Lachnospiraceae bacterium]|nr:CRISPR-associated DxTHG motif protein [Lachnospiraceae bacterium]